MSESRRAVLCRTIRLLGDAFTRNYPRMNVTVLSSLGSSGARNYVITQPTRSAPVQQFIACVASPDGRAIPAQTGHWLP